VVDKTVTEKMVDGTLWMFFAKFIDRSLGLISTLILLRLLAPDDFGLVAMGMVVYGFVDILVTFGFDVVLIQKKEVSRDHYDSVWTLRIIFYSVTAVILASIAPLSSRYFNDDRLSDVVFCLSFIFLLSAMTNIGVVEFRRNLDFKKEFWFSVAKKSTSFLVTIPLAYFLRSYWALVVGMLTSKFIEVFISYRIHLFRPRLSLAKASGVMRFSKWMLFNSILGFISDSLPNFVLGRLFGASSVGYYSVTQEVVSIPTTELVSVINRTTLPGYSKKRTDMKELKSSYLSVLSVISLVVWPVGLGIFSVADVLVPVVLGEGWLESVGLFLLLSPAVMLLGLSSNAWVVNAACGKPHMTSYIDLSRMLSLVVCMSLYYFVFVESGFLWVAKSFLFSSIVYFIVSNFVVFKVVGVGVIDLFYVHIRPVICSFLMFFVVSFVVDYGVFIYGSGVILLASVLIGLFSYFLLILFFWFLFGRPDGAELFFIKRFNGFIRG